MYTFSVNIKESELPDIPAEIPVVAVEIDPLIEKNYREKFYTAVSYTVGATSSIVSQTQTPPPPPPPPPSTNHAGDKLRLAR